MVFYRMVQADRYDPGSVRPWESSDRLDHFLLNPNGWVSQEALSSHDLQGRVMRRSAVSENRKVVGIDVSKATLDCAAVPCNSALHVATDAAGIAQLITWLHELKPDL